MVMRDLTVIMPVYNAMPYLSQAVSSILNQTMTDLRLLVIDDGSTDGSGEFLESVRDPRVAVVRQDNAGTGEARNRGLALCDTEYVANMDADDVALPDRLARQVEYMDRHPEVVMLGTQVDFLVEGKRLRGPRTPPTHDRIVSTMGSGRWGVSHATLLLRRRALGAVGGYRVPGPGQDLDLLSLVSLK